MSELEEEKRDGGLALNVDHSHVLSLLRTLLSAPVQTEQETEAIGAGCLLWDMSNSLAIAEFLCENSLFLVAEKILCEEHSPRLHEVICGILGNVASISPALCHALGLEDGLTTAVIGQLFIASDPALVGEALRILTAGCSLTTPVWRNRFDMEVCARVHWILGNTLVKQLQVRVLEFLYALVCYVDETEEARNELILALDAVAVCRTVSDAIVTSSSLAQNPSEEVLDLSLKVFGALRALDPRCEPHPSMLLILLNIISHTESIECKKSACTELVQFCNVPMPLKFLSRLWNCVATLGSALPVSTSLPLLQHIMELIFQELPFPTDYLFTFHMPPAFPNGPGGTSSNNGNNTNAAVFFPPPFPLASDYTLPVWFTKVLHAILKGTSVLKILEDSAPAPRDAMLRLLNTLLRASVVVQHCAQSKYAKKLATMLRALDVIMLLRMAEEGLVPSATAPTTTTATGANATSSAPTVPAVPITTATIAAAAAAATAAAGSSGSHHLHHLATLATTTTTAAAAALANPNTTTTTPAAAALAAKPSAAATAAAIAALVAANAANANANNNNNSSSASSATPSSATSHASAVAAAASVAVAAAAAAAAANGPPSSLM